MVTAILCFIGFSSCIAKSKISTIVRLFRAVSLTAFLQLADSPYEPVCNAC